MHRVTRQTCLFTKFPEYWHFHGGILNQVLATEETTLPSLEVFNENNPRALINLVSKGFAQKMREVPPELLQLYEPDLKKKVRPKAHDNRIRLAFWMEYERAQDTATQMKMENICRGVMPQDFFYNTYLTRAENVAWMICPPSSYETMTTEALHWGIERIREILDLEFVSPTGKINTEAAKLIIAATKMLDMRVKGGFIERRDVRQVNVHMKRESTELSDMKQALSMEEIESRIHALETNKRSNEALERGEVLPKGRPSIYQHAIAHQVAERVRSEKEVVATVSEKKPGED